MRGSAVLALAGLLLGCPHGWAETVSAPVADQSGALLEAVEQNHLETAAALVKAGVSVNAANRYGVSPLTLACRTGNAAMATLLLDAGAVPDPIAPDGETALMAAARTGDPECVRVMIERGASIDARERRGQTALMWAAHEGNAAAVKLLLEAGADFRTSLDSGFNPLLFAVRQGHIESVRLLLKAGADVNEAPKVEKPGGRNLRSGTAALMLAVENAHFELALELIKSGASVSDQRSEFTPLHAVTWARRTVRGDGVEGLPPPAGSGSVSSLEFVRTLAAAGADINARCETGQGGGGALHMKGATTFLLAAANSDLPLLKLLKELGADSSIPNVEDCPPLLAACGVGVTAPGEEPGTEAEAVATVNWLLDHGANINRVDQHGETAMHGAAYKIAPALVKLLDQRGADIQVWNRPNQSGWTPLLIAQGFRQGNFRPIAEMELLIANLMRAKGIDPPPAPSAKP